MLIGFNVDMLMLLEMDNLGSIDIVNCWSVGGHTHHVNVRKKFLCELKEQGMIIIKHIAWDTKDADSFTKRM